MNLRELLAEHRAVLDQSEVALAEPFQRSLDLIVRCLRGGGKVLICGNGGSAADAQHFAAELVGRYTRERAALPAVALTTDTSALTAIANDYGYENVFSRQVEALARAGDVLIGISTSGNSANVLKAATAAKARECAVIAMTGSGGGKLAALADVLVAVPSKVVARVQEVHELCLHGLADEAERQLAETVGGNA